MYTCVVNPHPLSYLIILTKVFQIEWKIFQCNNTKLIIKKLDD
jgi:hypothetical protein